MDSLKLELSKISNEDRTPLVDVLLELLAWQQKRIDELEQALLKLKGETIKPTIKPSQIDEGDTKDNLEADGDSSKPKKGRNASKT